MVEREILEKQLEGLESLEVKDLIDKCFVQEMYETGTRFLHIVGAKGCNGEISVLAYGAFWDEQLNTLHFYRDDSPVWFDEFEYGELKQVSEKELNLAILSNVKWAINLLISEEQEITL